MEHTRFVGLDIHKERISTSVAESGRSCAVEYLGDISNDPGAIGRLCDRLERPSKTLAFCYEAGPCGYGVHRQLISLGHRCDVVAPSLIPTRPGDRVKTNRRDAVSLARLLRAGELTEVWAPDERHEAMRDLVRARSTAVADLRRKRQQASAFLLRLGRHFPGKKTWGRAHMKWLLGQKLAHREQRVAFEEMMLAISEAQGRVGRLEQAIGAAVPDWSLAEMVTALMALRGVDLISATTLLAEIGDLGRFSTPRELMAWLGLVPSEASTGDRVRRGSITKAGNSRARRTLVESAHSYRYPARVGLAKQARVAAAPRAVREIAWKAQTRLTARYRALIKRGKLRNVVVTAIARELAGFIWAIHRALTEPRTAA